jgi:hypothetical protein
MNVVKEITDQIKFVHTEFTGTDGSHVEHSHAAFGDMEYGREERPDPRFSLECRRQMRAAMIAGRILTAKGFGSVDTQGASDESS